tara:strand:- start:629 stop:868 length:240 start_codon:yes stop_codon:yes gene_type:complete
MIEKIKETFANKTFITIYGFDSAILGLDENEIKLVYSVKKILEILEKTMTCEEALEYFYFNMPGSKKDINCPTYCYDNY